MNRRSFLKACAAALGMLVIPFRGRAEQAKPPDEWQFIQAEEWRSRAPMPEERYPGMLWIGETYSGQILRYDVAHNAWLPGGFCYITGANIRPGERYCGHALGEACGTPTFMKYATVAGK